MSGSRAAASIDTRLPPEPPAIIVGPRSSARIRPVSASACISDSLAPARHTSERPQLGRS